MATKSKPAPTEAEMKRTVRAWLRKNHPEAKDVQLTVWHSRGYAEEQLPILTPPDGWVSPDPLTPEQRDEINRAAAREGHRRSQARRCFVDWWGEFAAVVNDVYLQFQDLMSKTDLGLLESAGVDMGRLKEAGQHLSALASDTGCPPYTSGLNLWPTCSLTTTFAKDAKDE